jgi:hypothetical protein
MPRYPLQPALDQLPIAFRDATLLNTAIIEELARLRDQRRAENGHGNGRPAAPHLALNRAVVVAAVGGLEAYFESLATTARDLVSFPRGGKGWYTIVGRNGAIQTPSPENIRKLYWSLFHVDLEPHWELSVGTSAKDHGGEGTWRSSHNHVHKKEAATEFLNAMLQVRHSFAHMETKTGSATGMALTRSDGRVSVQSHHAFNAVSAAIQVAIQSTVALSDALELNGTPRWKSSWRQGGLPLSYWLIGSPLWETISGQWTGKFDEEVDSAMSAESDVLSQEAPSMLESP